MSKSVKIKTDTATIVIFDPKELNHRLQDSPDWWTSPKEALKEINSGNALFINVEEDGVYTLHILNKPPSTTIKSIETGLTIRSKEVCIAGGELTTGGGLEPGSDAGGAFIPIEPGYYEISVWRKKHNDINIAFTKVDHITKGTFKSVPKLA